MTAQPRVHQLLPAAHSGDATGDAALYLAEALRGAGYDAELFALTRDDDLIGRVHLMDGFPDPRAGDLTVLHFALPSPLSQALASYGGQRAIVYHNLTPPSMLAPFCPDLAELTARGAEELRWLARNARIDLAIGVSEFNRADLAAAGFPHTVSLPLSMDLARYDVAADPVVEARGDGDGPLVLTVGRLAPNKRVEDILRVAAYFLRHVTADARFVLVGGHRGLESYYDALERLHAELGLDDRVHFAGRVSHPELVAWYRRADAYLCASAHEGFCAPLLEAMHFEVPILAHSAAAVPETLGGAGILYSDFDPAALAEMLDVVLGDAGLRRRMQRRGRERLADFAPDRVSARWLDALGRLAGPL